MNELKKKQIKTVLKYTWPFYIVSSLLVVFGLYFIFNVTHRLPNYKTLTLFVSGEMKDSKKLREDLIEKYQDNELKSVSIISSEPNDLNYNSKLTIPGVNSADILIIPVSHLRSIVVAAFALELTDDLIVSYYPGFSFFQEDNVNYGIKLDKEKVTDYMTLPSEECYMVLNGKSENTGEYSSKGIKEHNNALNVVKDWGM